MIRILLVDDHAMVRRGLVAFLSGEEDFEIVGEAVDGRDAIDRMAVLAAHGRLPDVVLMDLVMPRVDGLTAIAQMTARWPSARVLALTSFLEEQRITAALDAGAAGYLLKDTDPDALARAIRTAASGKVALQAEVATAMVAAGRRHAPHAELTKREQDVLRLVADGASNQQIATTLAITERTARTHVSNILGKLGLATRTQAAMWAVRNGLVDGGPLPDPVAPPRR